MHVCMCVCVCMFICWDGNKNQKDKLIRSDSQSIRTVSLYCIKLL